MKNLHELQRMAKEELDHFLKELPEEVRPHAEAVPVFFHEFPSRQLTGMEDFEGIMGLFVGDSLLESQLSGQGNPASILLFLGELWDFSGEDQETFREEVRVTYAHELGHYLGWDEKDLEARGLE